MDVEILPCGHIKPEYGLCEPCKKGITLTDIYLYKYDEEATWMVGTSGRGRFSRTFIRLATPQDLKTIRKISEWID